MSDLPKVHFFICTHHKDPDKSSCANNENLKPEKFKADLKEKCKEKWGKSVRVNSAGCLGKCSRGVTGVIYPSGKWYFNLTENDLVTVYNDIEALMNLDA